uniref:Uncharacterized protein n=1 Tax=Oryza sativa subsp. japonica TaxID=39947 RepID=Q84ZK9_ORYSJ|nr:hypothetical protein [Oryza sativa Japonica Group]
MGGPTRPPPAGELSGGGPAPTSPPGDLGIDALPPPRVPPASGARAPRRQQQQRARARWWWCKKRTALVAEALPSAWGQAVVEAPESDRAAVAKRAQRQRISTVHETVAEARAAENSKSAPVFSSPSLRFTARARGDVGGWLTGCAARARVWARVERARPLEATCSDGRAAWTGAVRGDGNGRGGLCLSARACWTRPSGPGRDGDGDGDGLTNGVERYELPSSKTIVSRTVRDDGDQGGRQLPCNADRSESSQQRQPGRSRGEREHMRAPVPVASSSSPRYLFSSRRWEGRDS